MPDDASSYLFCYASSQKATRVLYRILDRFETSKQTADVMRRLAIKSLSIISATKVFLNAIMAISKVRSLPISSELFYTLMREIRIMQKIVI